MKGFIAHWLNNAPPLSQEQRAAREAAASRKDKFEAMTKRGKDWLHEFLSLKDYRLTGSGRRSAAAEAAMVHYNFLISEYVRQQETASEPREFELWYGSWKESSSANMNAASDALRFKAEVDAAAAKARGKESSAADDTAAATVVDAAAITAAAAGIPLPPRGKRSGPSIYRGPLVQMIIRGLAHNWLLNGQPPARAADRFKSKRGLVEAAAKPPFKHNLSSSAAWRFMDKERRAYNAGFGFRQEPDLITLVAEYNEHALLIDGLKDGIERDRQRFRESWYGELKGKLLPLVGEPGFGPNLVASHASLIYERKTLEERTLQAAGASSSAAAAASIDSSSAAGAAEDDDDAAAAAAAPEQGELEQAAAAPAVATIASEEEEIEAAGSKWIPSQRWCYWFLHEQMDLTPRKATSSRQLAEARELQARQLAEVQAW